MSNNKTRWMLAPLLLLAGLLLSSEPAYAHCDGMDGPVVAAGHRSLETGDVRYALVWVLPGHEAEIRSAFTHALDVRALGGEARALADRYFLETLVRVHRAGEGEPFTGLKPAGRDLGPVIPAADRAIESGSVEEVEAVLAAAIQKGVEQRFHAVLATRDHAGTDVAAGREFVKAYVLFLHYLEAVHEAAARAADDPHGH